VESGKKMFREIIDNEFKQRLNKQKQKKNRRILTILATITIILMIVFILRSNFQILSL
jgi:predicted nucleic acid-binding Zn ribbon protein